MREARAAAAAAARSAPFTLRARSAPPAAARKVSFSAGAGCPPRGRGGVVAGASVPPPRGRGGPGQGLGVRCRPRPHVLPLGGWRRAGRAARPAAPGRPAASLGAPGPSQLLGCPPPGPAGPEGSGWPRVAGSRRPRRGPRPAGSARLGWGRPRRGGSALRGSAAGGRFSSGACGDPAAALPPPAPGRAGCERRRGEEGGLRSPCGEGAVPMFKREQVAAQPVRRRN